MEKILTYSFKAALFFFLWPLLFLLFVPIAEAANTHTYVCDDFSGTGLSGVSCLGATWTFTNGVNGYMIDRNPSAYFLTAGTWYLTLTLTDGTGSFYAGVYGDNADGGHITFSTSLTDEPLTAPSGNSVTAGLDIANNVSGNAGGVITNLCISDTTGQCGGSSPPPVVPMLSTPPFAAFMDRYEGAMIYIGGGLLFLAFIRLVILLIEGFRVFMRRHSI